MLTGQNVELESPFFTESGLDVKESDQQIGFGRIPLIRIHNCVAIADLIVYIQPRSL
jgi:hypothetical protein